MLSFQRPSGLIVVEMICVPFDVGNLDELDHLKIQPIVVRVAADASLAGSGLQLVAAMQAPLGGYTGGDFGVALQAFELRLSATKLVTISAMRRAVQLFMRLCQRAGRDLRVSDAGEQQSDQEQDRGEPFC